MKREMTNILLVEDNPADARYAKELLSTQAYTFVEARSMAQAIECLNQKTIDVILLDLSLPDSNGLETVAHLAEQKRELPIVVLTGLEDISFALESVRVGANDYVVKARLDADSLARSIKHAIEAKKRQNTEHQLVEQMRLANLSAAIGQCLIEGASLQQMMSICTDALTANLDVCLTALWTIDEAKHCLRLQAESIGRLTDNHGTIAVGQGTIGSIAATKTKLVIEDVHSAPILKECPWLSEESIQTFAGYPLMVGEHVLGVLGIFSKSRLEPSALAALPALANQLAIGIDRLIAAESRSLLAAIVHQSEDAIISIAPNGVIVTCNDAASKLQGYTAEEMIGRNLESLISTANLTELSSIKQSLKTGEPTERLELTCIRKDGTIVETDFMLSPIKDTFGKVYGASAIIRDITARRRAELYADAQNKITRVLSESETLAIATPSVLRALAKTIHCRVASLWIVERNTTNLHCLEVWSDGDANLSEFIALTKHITLEPGPSLPGTVLASKTIKFIKDVNEEPGFVRIHSAIKGGIRSAIGFPLIVNQKVLGVLEFMRTDKPLPDPEWMEWVINVAAQIAQFIERKFAEEQSFRATQAQLRIAQAITENAPIGIARLDRNLIINEANRAFCQQIGISRDRVIGTYMFQHHIGISNELFLSVLDRGEPLSISNMSTLHDTETIYSDLTIWPIKDDDNQTSGLVVMIIDVTERTQTARQRDDFVATLSHDLKNPLIGQHRIFQAMLSGSLGAIDAEQKEMLSVVETSTVEMLELIGTLLDVYHYEGGKSELKFKNVDVEKLIKHCITQLGAASKEKRIQITHECTISELVADESAMRRLFMNLLDNAIKFTRPNGRINIYGQIKPDDLTVARFIIEDNGAGIHPDELPLLFQRFSQTSGGRTRKAGTGLGLYLCRQIAEAHGGHIECKSSLGEGSSFIIEIPLVSVDAER